MSGLGFVLAGVVALLLVGALWFHSSRERRRNQRQLQARLDGLRTRLPPPSFAVRGRFVAGQGGGPRFLQVWLAQADITLQPRAMVLGGLGAVGLAAVAGWAGGLVLGAVVLAVLVLAAMFGLRYLAAKRIAALIAGLPFFLDAMRQLLMVGNSLQQALLKAAENSGDDMQRYLRPLVRRIVNGAAIPESMIWLADRLDVPELHMLATAVQTNFRYGGRMSTVLGNLAQILRDGARVQRELKAATAELRLSAIVVSLVPPVAGGAIAAVNPNYIWFLFEDAQGQNMLMVAVVLQILGMIILRRLMRLDF